jgi:hypothetical protein
MLKFVGTSRSSTAKVFKCTLAVDEEISLPVKEGTHKAFLCMAAYAFLKEEETFTLRELGNKAEELGLTIAKEGAKTDAAYLASYYKKFMVQNGVIAEV